jgi:hypothetical protein
MQINAAPIFPTVVHHAQPPGLDCQTINRIVYHLREAGHTFSNPGSQVHQTTGNIMAIDHPAIVAMNNAFFEMVRQATNAPVLPILYRGWANISPPNDATVGSHPHGHLPFHYSAVFYPKTPKFIHPEEGRLLFVDSREVYAGTQYVGVIPENGMMVLFPSWLRHTVNPFRGTPGEDFDRISISMNVILGTAPDHPQMLPPHRVRARVDPQRRMQFEIDPQQAPFKLP